MSEIKDLTEKVINFRDERDWKQFHKPKDMAVALSLEAAEVLEHFQWRSEKEAEDYVKAHRSEIGEELADVFYWILLISHDLKIDIVDTFIKKIKKNGENYPVEKSRGTYTKYTKLT